MLTLARVDEHDVGALVGDERDEVVEAGVPCEIEAGERDRPELAEDGDGTLAIGGVRTENQRADRVQTDDR